MEIVGFDAIPIPWPAPHMRTGGGVGGGRWGLMVTSYNACATSFVNVFLGMEGHEPPPTSLNYHFC